MCGVFWDMVVSDEAHSMGGALWDVVVSGRAGSMCAVHSGSWWLVLGLSLSG